MSSSSAATASTPTPPIPTATPLTYSASGLPDGISINPSTGAISGTLSFASAGVHTVLVTVSDGHRHRHRQLHLDGDRHQPGAGLQHRPAVDRTDAEGELILSSDGLDADATDPDGDTLTYSASGLPDGISINPSTGAISGTLSFASAGVHTVRSVTVSDRHRHRHRQLHLDGDRHQPGAGLQHRPAVDRTDAEGELILSSDGLDADATDPDGDTLTYSASGLPDGISINPSTGAISGTLSFASAGVHTVLVTVSDDTDTDTDAFTWTVTGTAENQAPVLAPIGDKTVAAGSTVVVELSSTDPDGDARTFSLGAGAPDWASLVDHGDGTATLSLSPDASDIGSHDLTISVSDGSLQDSETFNVEVIQGIALRASAVGTNTGATNLVLPKPAGTVAGDVLIAAVTVRSTPTITAPVGWTTVRTDTRGNALRQAVFVHVAAPGEPTSYTWTFSQALTAVGTIAAYSGVDTANPINAHNGQATASSTTITAPSVTTNVANAELVAFFGITGKTGLTPPSGMTEQREVSTPNGAGTKVTGALADELRLPSGATGSRLATIAAAAAQHRSVGGSATEQRTATTEQPADRQPGQRHDRTEHSGGHHPLRHRC